MADDATVGYIAWTNPNNAKVSDDSYATADCYGTHYLKATNFGFSVPTGATINGITAEFETKYISGTENVYYGIVKIVKADGTIGSTNRGGNEALTWSYVADHYDLFGANNDLWGEIWTAEDINNYNFGVVITGNDPGDGSGSAVGGVDHIRITVYYTPAASTLSNISSISNIQSITF